MQLAITIDVENDLGFASTHFGLDEGMPALLDLLQKHDIRATFFVSGEVITHTGGRDILRSLDAEGQEIASHGGRHTDYRNWEEGEIRREIKDAKAKLEDLIKKPLLGFRAPQFLVDSRLLYILRDCGFRYDSSFPGQGLSMARTFRKVRVDQNLTRALGESGLKEFPISTIPILSLPHGLLWTNIISLRLYQLLFPSFRDDLVLFYLHPYDVVNDKERLYLNWKRSLFYLRNRNRTLALFEELIQFWISRKVSFVTLRECLGPPK